MGNVLTCIYCGQAYPSGTPASGADVKVLTDHIKICEKHPLRKAEETIFKLRKALIGLVGTEMPDELRQMEICLRALPLMEDDKILTINAINAILETAEN